MFKRITVIGSGYWGKNLVRNFYQLGRVDIVCDIDLKVLEATSKQYQNIKTTNSLKEAITETEAVVIATPAITHYQLVRDALKLNKDVFVEKPLALTVKEGEELVELAKVKKRVLMVGHLLEYHPAIVKLKELIDQGELGKIYCIYSNRLNLGKIRQEENILWSFAPHDISVILKFLNEMPIKVSCNGESYITKGVLDTTVSHFVFANGVQAHVFVNWLNPFKEQKLVVMGSAKMAVFDDTIAVDKLVLYSHQHQIDSFSSSLITNKGTGQVVSLEKAEPLKVECQHFLDCIDNSKEPITDGKSALKVLEILEACQLSLEKERSIFLGRNYFVASSAIVETEEIGQKTKIWHYSHIMKGAKVGQYCKIGKYVSIESGAVVGDRVKIQNYVSVFSGVVIEDNVFIGPGVRFTNVKRPRSEFPAKKYEKTLIKKGATIGANATVICGVTIGEYAFIGAGAVVIEDVPPYALVVGNPAEIIGRVNKKGERIE